MADARVLSRPPLNRLALYLMLGFSAGLPFYMFNAVLTLRLARHGVDIVLIGFFAWIALLPTFKFVWAPLLDRFDVPGFGRFWGKRRGWIMVSQLGIALSLAAMAYTADDSRLPLTALFAILLAFWTTTLEVAADGWRIELAPTQAEQGPIVAANLWGYRGAMVAAGSGAVYVAGKLGWTWAYVVIAAAAFLPFPIMALMPAEPAYAGRSRLRALGAGACASAGILLGSLTILTVAGWIALNLALAVGITSRTNVTPVVLAIALLPFIALALALPRIRAMRADAPARQSRAIGPYVDIFWRYGYTALPVLAFVSFYRMGDVMTLTLSHPLWNARGYSLNQIAMADGAVALLSIIAGVAIGGWIAARWRMGLALMTGAIASAIGNWIFVWLWHAPSSDLVLYSAAGIDQFAHGVASAVFVVYLSLLVNRRYPVAQYAFLSGFAFLLPRLLAGAGGAITARIGYDGFFLLSGTLSAAAILFLPFIMRVKPRAAEALCAPEAGGVSV